jgi:prepilin-type N-terminal cleavage/methylation domain-containing protein
MKGKGYTLIELLIGLSVIGLIFSFGFVSFREFSRRQSLISAGRTLTGQLRLTQELALSGNKPDDPLCNSSILHGYQIKIVTNSNYVIEASCSSGNVQVKTIDLSVDISISTPTPNPILFKVLGQGTNIDAPDATITLTQIQTGATRDVVISKSGEIK